MVLVAGPAAALVAVVSPAAADDVVWNGFGRGRTPERAIAKAIDDVEIMAAGEGFFDCVLIEEPVIFPPGTWDPSETTFTAGVNMTCE